MTLPRPSKQQPYPTHGSAYDLPAREGDYIVSDWAGDAQRVLIYHIGEPVGGMQWMRVETIEERDGKLFVQGWMECWQPVSFEREGSYEAIADCLRYTADDDNFAVGDEGYHCEVWADEGNVTRNGQGLPQLCRIKYNPLQPYELTND